MNSNPEKIDLTDGCVWAVDKPYGWSSFHVVKKLRGALLSRVRAHGVRKLKVGHAGTLDPLATGVMLICLGKATKEIERLQSGVKEYIATVKLGATTPSFDLETPIDAEYPTEHITKELIESVLPRFRGEIRQVPPAYSAVKVDGKRSYKLARGGETVELKPKLLVIDYIDIEDFSPESMTLTLKVICSKGTYIRALARDIGEALGSGAHLTALRRTRVGDYAVGSCLSIEDTVDGIWRAEITVKDNATDTVTVIPPAEPPARSQDTAATDSRDILPYAERVAAMSHAEG